MMAPPDAAAGKLIEPEAPAKTVTAAPMPEIVAAVGADAEAEAIAPKLQRTEFGVDVGGANSVGGLRALWRGLLKSKSNAPLSALRPIIVVKEGAGGLGLQLRLVAGPLRDAAAAAKICATLVESQRTCETTVFDGQRLSLQGDEPPAAVKPAPRKRSSAKPKPAAVEEPAKKPETSHAVVAIQARPIMLQSQCIESDILMCFHGDATGLPAPGCPAPNYRPYSPNWFVALLRPTGST